VVYGADTFILFFLRIYYFELAKSLSESQCNAGAVHMSVVFSKQRWLITDQILIKKLR
jgi:hypothetical protein